MPRSVHAIGVPLANPFDVTFASEGLCFRWILLDARR
jgi:hypothetical protein